MTAVIGHKTLITGAASGIGRLMAIKIMQKGGEVIAWDINEQGLASLKEELNGQIDTYIIDMTKKDDIFRVAGEVLDKHGRVDILINNAGIVQGKPILETDDALIERTFAINVLAHFWTVKSFLPGMVERRWGHIVTVASAGGITATARLVDYSSSKFAAVGFDEALRLELKHHGQKIRDDRRSALLYQYRHVCRRPKNALSQFIMPILEPDYVAEKIIHAIETINTASSCPGRPVFSRIPVICYRPMI